jgi:hypothetical protein
VAGVLIEEIVVLVDLHFVGLLIPLRVMSRGACTASWHGELTVEGSAFLSALDEWTCIPRMGFILVPAAGRMWRQSALLTRRD